MVVVHTTCVLAEDSVHYYDCLPTIQCSVCCVDDPMSWNDLVATVGPIGGQVVVLLLLVLLVVPIVVEVAAYLPMSQ